MYTCGSRVRTLRFQKKKLIVQKEWEVGKAPGKPAQGMAYAHNSNETASAGTWAQLQNATVGSVGAPWPCLQMVFELGT